MATAREEDMDKRIGNHMGCMAGFFHLRFSSPRRLPPSLNVESESASEKSSPLVSKELGSHKHQSRSSTPELRSPAPEPPSDHLTRSPLTLPILEFKEGSSSPWKFSKEAPRLSLDSRAVVDAKGSLKPRQIRPHSLIPPANRPDSTDSDSQRRSPSVIAKLMGLEPLPTSDPDHPHKAELRRSASESRVNREYRFVDGLTFQNLQSISGNPFRDEKTSNGDDGTREFPERSAPAQSTRAPQQRCVVRRKSFFDSTDFFPEPKQTGSMPGDLDKRIRVRGIDEHPSDLETLKQLLEALRLKGLLHSSSNQQSRIGNRNFVFESQAKPHRSPAHLRGSRHSSPIGIRSGAVGVASPSVSPRRERGGSSARDQNRGRSNGGNRRAGPKESAEHQRRVSPAQSPKVVAWRRPEPVQTAHRRNRGGTMGCEEEEECFSMVSRSGSVGTCSQAEEERWKVEEYKREGKDLLERCDKLLHSIAEMTAASESQPSPVSVLDSSLYQEESSPSPVMKRTLDFTEQPLESEDEAWGSMVSSLEDSEFIYISDILRASDYLPRHSDVFSLLEKQQYLKGKSASKAAVQERRLIFDAVQEILGQRRLLPPWRAVGQTSLQHIWSDFQKIRGRGRGRSSLSDLEEEEEDYDLAGVVCGALRRDLAEDSSNGHVEWSEAVRDIERLIFKDLISETIHHLAALRTNRTDSLRRRLVFE